MPSIIVRTWVKNEFSFLFIGKKQLNTRFGWGLFEGQCDKDGNCNGKGCFVVTNTPSGADYEKWIGMTYEGFFRFDKPHGFGP